MKNSFKKIIATVVFMIMMFNFITPISLAEYTVEKEEEFLDKQTTEFSVGTIVDGVAGFLLLPLKIIIQISGMVLRGIAGGVAMIGGVEDSGWDAFFIAPEDILFNKLNITNINFFDFELDGAMKTIRENIAGWYYALRNLAITILLAVLIYVGIRMALSTIAESEAKYKKMLMDWVVSFILIFVLHYIMLFTININNGLVDIFDGAREHMMEGRTSGDMVTAIGKKSGDLRLTVGMGSAVVFLILVGITFVFLIIYIKRMITIAFLIMISPIVTLTYSIDKLGDGKAQALNTWMKEFIYNILIQPFHCLIYLAFVASTFNLLASASLAASVLSILFITFIFPAEKIVRDIFNFRTKSTGDGMATAAAVMVGAQAIGNAFKQKGSGDSEKDDDTSSKGKSTNQNLGRNVANSKNSSTSGTGGTRDNMGGAGGSGGNANSEQNKSGKGRQVAGVFKDKVFKGRTGGQLAYDIGVKGLRTQAKAAGFVVGAALGASTGDASKVLAGGAAGGAIANKMLGDKGINTMHKNEQRLALAYQDYKQDNNFDDEQMLNKTNEILAAGDVNNLAEADKDYGAMVLGMRDIYEDSGVKEDKINDKMEDTISKIQKKEITPRVIDVMKK